jgi:hypothetical protein
MTMSGAAGWRGTGKILSIGVVLGALVIWPARGEAAEAKGGRKVIRLEAIKVEGRIQKPQAFYVLQRSNLNFEGLELRQSFLPKIVQSVEKEPF